MVALGWQGGVTIGVMVTGLISMAIDVVPPDYAFWGMTTALLAAGIIDTQAAGAGFGNASALAILALYAVSSGVEQTGALDSITGRVLGSTRSAAIALSRIVLPVALASAFLSNLLIVSLLIPTLRGWARRHGVAQKQFLIPLSFATVLGGTATTMGTSTNLLVSGLMQQRYRAAGGADGSAPPPFGLFAISPYGVPYALWGCAYLVAMARWLLPTTDTPSGGGGGGTSGGCTTRRRRRGAETAATDDAMTSALAVPRGSPAAGRLLDDLLARAGVTLVAVGRGGNVLPPPPPRPDASVAADRVAREGDVLYVSGRVDAARQLAAEAGLALIDDASEDDALDALGVGGLPPRAASAGAGVTIVTPGSVDGGRRAPSPLAWGENVSSPSSASADTPPSPPPPPPDLFRVRVRPEAPVAGLSVRDARLRSRFGATVVAVSYAGTRASVSGASTPQHAAAATPAPGRIGDTVLAPGDAVVLAVGPSFDAGAHEFAANFGGATPLDCGAALSFSTALTVKRGSRIEGRTPAEAGFTGVPGVLLFAVRRADGATLVPPPPDLALTGGDVLWFAGGADAVPFLRRFPGLAHSADGHAAKLATHAVHRRLVQACVSAHSPLAGRTLRDVAFRTRYGAAVVAVHRAGAALAADIACVPLKPGDVLVLEAGPGFAGAAATRRAFSVISELPHSAPPKPVKRWVALAWVLAMVACQVATAAVGGKVEERADLFLLASLTAAGMLASRCMSFDAARAAIEWEVYVTVAFAFGVATALEKSGVGALVATGFEAALSHGGHGPPPAPATLTVIYLATCIISEFVSNDAAAALMYPISATLADALSVPPRDAAIAVMLGGSAGWIIPFSYQCNIAVMAAGQYTFGEFARFGAPFYVWQVPFVAFQFWCGGAHWWIPTLVGAAAFTVSPFIPMASEVVGRRLEARRARRSCKGEKG